MKPITSISAQAIHDLWGEGFTVIPRLSDPFPEVTAPDGLVYQWNLIGEKVQGGWSPVPIERHPGIFAPYGTTGEISLRGMALEEKPVELVENFHQEVRRKAQKNVDNWFERQSAAGFSGQVAVADGRGGKQTEIGSAGEGEVNQTKIPLDLIPYIAILLKQRDAIVAEFTRATPELIVTPSLRAHAMESAIMFLRAQIAKENDNGTSANPSDGSGAGSGNSTGGSGHAVSQAEPPSES